MVNFCVTWEKKFIFNYLYMVVMGYSFSVFGKLYCGLGGRARKDCGVSGCGEETVRGSRGDYKAGHSGNRYIYSMSLVRFLAKT